MTSQQGLQDLEAFQFGPEGRTFPLFHSWKTEHFGRFALMQLWSCASDVLQVLYDEIRLPLFVPEGTFDVKPSDLHSYKTFKTIRTHAT